MTKQPTKVQRLTWLGRPWRDRAVLHPLFGTGVAFAAAEVLHVTEFGDDQHWLLRGAASVALPIIGGAAGLAATAGERFCDAARAYFSLAGLTAGGYLAAVAWSSPYNMWTGLAAGAGLALSTAAYPSMRASQLEWEANYRARRAKPQPATAQTTTDIPHATTNPEAAKWEALFARVGAANLTYRDRIPTRCGFSILMRLPDDGKITFPGLTGKTERLEIATGLSEGAITFERATDNNGRALAREVWVHFDVEDVLSQLIHMPDEHTPLSINNAFTIGKYSDGEPIHLKLREIAALIVGVRGRGKTNLLNVMIHQLSRCTDVVIWMIDLKGGRAVKPWLRPWLEEKVDRPVLDWVATDRIEAHRMLTGARALIDQRGQSGIGGSKIKPTRDLPAVIVICDEIAALVGMRSGPKSAKEGQGETSNTLAGILTGCIQLGRSEAVDFVLATQRSTVTMIGNGDLKSQCELRIGLGVTTPQDARSVFEGNGVAARMLNKLKDKATRGAVLIQDGDGGRIAPGKSFFMGDDDEQAVIYRAAELHANYPAPLDTHGQAAVDAAVRSLGDGQAGYTDRWSEDRAGHLYTEGVPQAPSVPTQRVPAQQSPAPVSAIPTSAEGRQQESRFFPRSKPEPPKEDPWAAEWAKIVDSFESSTALEPDYETVDAEEDDGINRYEAMIQIIADCGKRGAMPGDILARMVKEKTAWKARSSMYPALKKALQNRRIVQPAGTKGRYYTPENAN
ncbi:hypothetical protein ACH4T9_12720 [Micromonospora sp. NPDC020750]|uniref:hypothetical protein n=1 Tax=unclassified Micromonospora TaxID=2617518 RepID=UPI003793AC42